MVRHVIACIRNCDLELAGLASAAYVAGHAALIEDEQEQEQRATCIDLGGDTTGLSVFAAGHMVFAPLEPPTGWRVERQGVDARRTHPSVRRR